MVYNLLRSSLSSINSVFENQFSLTFSVYDEEWQLEDDYDTHDEWRDVGRLKAGENLGITYPSAGFVGVKTTKENRKVQQDNHGFDMLGIYPGVIGQNIGIAYGTIFIVYKSRTLVPPSAFSTEWIDNVIIHEISHLFGAKDHDSWDTTEIAIQEYEPYDWYVTDWGDVSIMTYPNSGVWYGTLGDAELLIKQIGADKAWFQLYNWLPEDIGDDKSGMTKDINNRWWTNN